MFRDHYGLLSIILPFVMSCSCATDTPAGATFDDVVLWSYNSDSLYVVIAGDLSTYKLIKEESMIKKILN